MRAVLFDLDGTLIDTAPELAAALDQSLCRAGLPPAGDEPVRGWIGDGARALLAKALRATGMPAEQVAARVDALWEGFDADYARACGTCSTLYPGARELLDRLRRTGLQIGLVTNKESGFVQRLLAHHRLDACFDVQVCGDTLPVRKPDPAMLTHALQALRCAPHDALYIGDSALDVRTARAAGVPVWAVAHGYGGALLGDDAPDRTIAHFDDAWRAIAAPHASR